jgi:hypothetical protein
VGSGLAGGGATKGYAKTVQVTCIIHELVGELTQVNTYGLLLSGDGRLGIAAQIKIMGEPSLLFTGLWFGIYLGLPSEKYKIVSWKKIEFEDL